MNWLKRLLGSSNNNYFSFQQNSYSMDLDGCIDPEVEIALKRNSPLLSAITRKHRKDIKKINFGIDAGKELTPIDDDIKYKNYNLSNLSSDFMEDLDIDGNIYMEKTGGILSNGKYSRIRPADIMWQDKYTITVSRSGGKQTVYKKKSEGIFESSQSKIPSLIYHARLLDLINIDTGRGESPMLSIQNAVYMTIYATQHNSTYLQKGMKSDMIITSENTMNKNDFQSFKDEFNKQHSGMQNTGKPVFLANSGKTNLLNLQGNTKDMDFKNLIDTSDQQIAKVYDFPLALISQDNQTYNNYATAISSYYRDSIIPGIGFILDFYNIIFGVKFKIDETSIPALKEEKIRISKDMATAGIYSINECRAETGYNEVVGGEEIYRPASDIPIGSDLGGSNGE